MIPLVTSFNLQSRADHKFSLDNVSTEHFRTINISPPIVKNSKTHRERPTKKDAGVISGAVCLILQNKIIT